MKEDKTPSANGAAASVPEKKPWPLSRVVLAIAVFVVCYTLIMVFFRKETPMFYPYEEAQAEVLGNLLRADGWEPLPEAYVIREFRVPREELELIDLTPTAFDTEDTIGLEIGEHSTTPLNMESIKAPESISIGEPYQAEIHWREKEERAYPNILNFYVRGGEILIFPPHGRIRPTEHSEPLTRFLIPPEQFTVGEHTLYVYTEEGLRGWNLIVEE